MILYLKCSKKVGKNYKKSAKNFFRAPVGEYKFEFFKVLCAGKEQIMHCPKGF